MPDCTRRLNDGDLICTGEGHPFGCTYVSTGGGADAEAGGDGDE